MRFNLKWFKSFDWFKYSVKVNRVFCVPCYLFNDHVRTQVGGHPYILESFGNWSKIQEIIKAHIEKVAVFIRDY